MYKESPLLKEQTDYFRDTRGNDGKERAGRGGRARGAQQELSCSHLAMSWAQTPGWAGQDAEQGSAPHSSPPPARLPSPSPAPEHPGKRGRGEMGVGCGWLLGKEERRLDATPFCFISEGFRSPSAISLSSFLLSWVFLLQMGTCSAISGLDHPSPAPCWQPLLESKQLHGVPACSRCWGGGRQPEGHLGLFSAGAALTVKPLYKCNVEE